jgi:hypothetical protein
MLSCQFIRSLLDQPATILFLVPVMRAYMLKKISLFSFIIKEFIKYISWVPVNQYAAQVPDNGIEFISCHSL